MQARQQMTPAMGFFFARIFPFFFVISGPVILFFGVRNLMRANESHAWPAVSGVIQISKMEYQSGKDGGTYHAHIVYAYTLNGANYSGDRVTFGDYGSSFSSHAQEILNQYPAGKNVMVHYKPGQPELCCLQPGLSLFAWFTPVLGAAFFFAGMAIAIIVPKRIKMYFASIQQSGISTQ